MAWNSRIEQERDRRVIIPPPDELSNFDPSSLMNYFLEAGAWSHSAFALEVSKRHKSRTMSTDTVSQWANHNVLPKRYRMELFKVIAETVEPDFIWAWRRAFNTVWSAYRASKSNRLANTLSAA
jgi:hypothetical protein